MIRQSIFFVFIILFCMGCAAGGYNSYGQQYGAPRGAVPQQGGRSQAQGQSQGQPVLGGYNEQIQQEQQQANQEAAQKMLQGLVDFRNQMIEQQNNR